MEYVTSYSLSGSARLASPSSPPRAWRSTRTPCRPCQADGIPVPYIADALQAALHTVRGDDAKAASYLARFWGLEQDRALGRLFSCSEGRLLARPAPLLTASAELAPRLRRPAYSFHAILAAAVLAHYARPVPPGTLGVTQAGDRLEALSLRSNVMGILIGDDDFDLAGSLRPHGHRGPAAVHGRRMGLPHLHP